MKRNKIAIINIALLTLFVMVFWTPSVSATPQHRIILPFHTSWENEQPLGRTDAVDWKTSDFYGYYGPDDPLQPELGWRNNEVSPPSDVFGFEFGSRQLMAAGYFGSSYSYCYFNLFDTTADTDWGTPFKIKPHTFINIWYYHMNLGDSMIDAQIYNKGTEQYWTLRDFNSGGEYIVDQNGVRVHPACRWNDPIGSWEFTSFDLSIIYESDPENWYITKIWIAFDNDPSLGDGATGQARTYFDMFHISYGKADVETCTEGNDNAYTGGSITAWYHHLRPDGYYNLWLKVAISGFNDGYMTDWLGIHRNLYPLILKVSVSNPDAQALNNPMPSGVNLTEQGESAVGEFIADVIKTLATYAYFPYDWYKDATELSQEFVALVVTPELEPTYQWPEVEWLQPLYWEPKNYALGEVYILVPGLSPGTHSISVTFSVDYYWPDPFPFPRAWTPIFYETVSVTLNFEWSTEPDSNLPPATPSTPSGTTSGYSGTSYTYSSDAIDPEDDNIRYQFDWGDGSTHTTGRYTSGSTAYASHSWGSSGTYNVKVRAQDEYGLWSGWSPYLPVTLVVPVYLSISTYPAGAGTTDPAPGIHAYSYGSSVTVTAIPYPDRTFSYWILDGSLYKQNPITVTMNSLHALCAYFSGGGGGGGGGGGSPRDTIYSPTLFVWNGSEYVKEVTLDLHGDSDVTVWHTIEQLLVPEDDHYLLSLRELNESISHIDYVKLYAVDTEGEMYEHHLIYAVHNELENVKQLLLFDDDNRVNLGPSHIIDLKFNAAELENIDHFIFEIQGYEPT